MSVAPQSVVDAAQAAFMQGGVSISAASCGARPFPSVCRVLACSVSEDRCRLTVVVARSCAQELLDDVGHSGRIAVVFSQPSTHRTIQVKGDHARPGMPDASLVEAVRIHSDAFVDEVAPLGFAAPLVRSLLAFPDGDMVAITFIPNAAYDQSPGPRAGAPLQAGA
nr:hypothetical protein [uncultured Noviherbaspirillum sp.]